MQNFLNDPSAVLPAIFSYAGETHSASSEADALLVLPDDVSGRFSGRNRATYSFLKVIFRRFIN
jgi:hypothetical protein